MSDATEELVFAIEPKRESVVCQENQLAEARNRLAIQRKNGVWLKSRGVTRILGSVSVATRYGEYSEESAGNEPFSLHLLNPLREASENDGPVPQRGSRTQPGVPTPRNHPPQRRALQGRQRIAVDGAHFALQERDDVRPRRAVKRMTITFSLHVLS
jgi:hypothetical protein